MPSGNVQSTQTQDFAMTGEDEAGPLEFHKGSRRYFFETFETIENIPADEAKDILMQQAQFMHRRVMESGAPANNPASHVSSFWKNIDAVLPPKGRFYLVRDIDRNVIGCGAVRKLSDTIAEMKHLFVHDDHRGQGLGRELVLRRLDDARTMGVKTVLADTIKGYPEMPTLYNSLGFKQVEPTETSGTLNVAPQIADCLIFFRKKL